MARKSIVGQSFKKATQGIKKTKTIATKKVQRTVKQTKSTAGKATRRVKATATKTAKKGLKQAKTKAEKTTRRSKTTTEKSPKTRKGANKTTRKRIKKVVSVKKTDLQKSAEQAARKVGKAMGITIRTMEQLLKKVKDITSNN